MRVYDTPSIRNVAVVGHSGAGKTQLTSTMLFDAGMVNRLGTVDDGTTVTDFDEEAIARKHTLSAGVAYAEWNKHKINFIDTPGMAIPVAPVFGSQPRRCNILIRCRQGS